MFKTRGIPTAVQIKQHVPQGGYWLLTCPGRGPQILYLDETSEDTIEGVRFICAPDFFTQEYLAKAHAEGEEDLFGLRHADRFDPYTCWPVDLNGNKVDLSFP